jgi:hypothetical protein
MSSRDQLTGQVGPCVGHQEIRCLIGSCDANVNWLNQNSMAHLTVARVIIT